jgi:hypothetical protein
MYCGGTTLRRWRGRGRMGFGTEGRLWADKGLYELDQAGSQTEIETAERYANNAKVRKMANVGDCSYKSLDERFR